MSDRKNFSRRRRGGMRFRPSGDATRKLGSEARSQAVGESTGGDEKLFDKSRQGEIERAENIAAGLPAEGATAQPAETASKRDFREPHLDTPAEVKEDTFTPV